jgi:hypothetical protein
MGLVVCYRSAWAQLASQDVDIPPLEKKNFHPFIAARYEPWNQVEFDVLSGDLLFHVGVALDLLRYEFKEPLNSPLSNCGFPGYRFDRIVLSPAVMLWGQLNSSSSGAYSLNLLDYYVGADISYDSYYTRTPDARLKILYIGTFPITGSDSESIHINDRKLLLIDFALGRAQGEFSDNVAAMMLPPGRPYVGVASLVDLNDAAVWNQLYFGLDIITTIKKVPITFAYEFRLNTEQVAIGEHNLRAGVRFAQHGSPGITAQLGYFTGRSLYGPDYLERVQRLTVSAGLEF